MATLSEDRPAATAPISDAERAARQALAACYRVFDHLGWSESVYNHITLRVPGEEGAFLINPFGLHFSEVTASSLVKIDLDGNPLGDSPCGVNRAGFVLARPPGGPGAADFAAMVRRVDRIDPSWRD